MPDPIRRRCENTHPSRKRFEAVLAVAALLPDAAHAQAQSPLVTDYLAAFGALDRNDTAALVLSLGVILFGVVTAIALLRTRARAARLLAARQAELNALREERDRANALLHSESQLIVVWPAGADEPEITGDVSIAIRSPLPRRVLAFGTWLEPEKAHAMELSLIHI